MRIKFFILTIGIAISLSVSPTFAIPLPITYDFFNISGNSSVNAATGEAQLKLDVYDLSGDVQFLFNNLGPLASTITKIYFDDDESNRLLPNTFAILDNAPFVIFDQLPAIPAELPGANEASPPFVTTGNLSAGAANPSPHFGVNPGESVSLLFTLAGPISFADVINAMNMGELRAGIHVQAFSDGGSESFVTGNGTTPVREPATMLLFGVGLVGLAGFGRKKLLKKK